MKTELKDETGKRVHPYVPELCEQLRKGEVDRRDFLRTATLLGVSAGAAYAMAGNILGQGYMAGFGMTIGTVFGRIAGKEAARYAIK